MVNLYRNNPTNTFAVYPDVTASLSSNPSVSYIITLTQDYDKSVTTFTGSLANTPTRVNPRLVFQVTGSAIPEWSGLYGFKLQETLYGKKKWGEANIKWADTNVKWGDAGFIISQSVLDENRAKVFGNDTITFNQYTGSVQTGAYTTYHL